MARIGSTAAAPFLGGTFVSLYLGATRVPTVPGRPAWDGTPSPSGGNTVAEPFFAPTNNGGSAVTGYRVFVDGELVDQPASSPIQIELPEPGTYEIALAAVNAVGEGPRLTYTRTYTE